MLSPDLLVRCSSEKAKSPIRGWVCRMGARTVAVRMEPGNIQAALKLLDPSIFLTTGDLTQRPLCKESLPRD